jgi:hypothetical protein
LANFNLNDYETVEQRHARAIAAYPDLRCVIVNHTTVQDRQSGVWVVEARVYLSADDQANDLPKAVDWAFEVDGQGMANKTSALENASTSALGRALRWALAGSKGASREEMQKVVSGVTPQPVIPANILSQIQDLPSRDAARAFYKKMANAGAEDNVLRAIEVRANELK